MTLRANIDKTIDIFYDKYSKIVNPERATPHIFDGMRLVERRIFWLIYNKLPNNKSKKSSWVVGTTMAEYHPHGDMSLYGSLVNIVKETPFLIYGQGNWGNDKTLSEEPPAAMRYTEVRKGILFDKYFKYANMSDLTLKDTENKEPEFIPTPIPYALISGFTGIGKGKGFKTYIPKYKIEDLILRLEELLTNKQNKTIIKPYFNGLKVEGDFEKILKEGEGNLIVYGEYIKKDNKIIITKKPPYYDAEKLNKLLNKLSYNVNVNDYSHDETEIIISTTLKKNIDDLEKKIKNSLQTKFTVNILLFTGDKFIKIGVDEWLIKNFKNYIKYKEKYINKEIKKYKDQIELLKILKLYIPIYKKNLNKINNKNEFEIFINDIKNKLNINDEILSKILSISNKKLLTLKIDIDKYKDQIEELEFMKQYIEIKTLKEIKKDLVI